MGRSSSCAHCRHFISSGASCERSSKTTSMQDGRSSILIRGRNVAEAGDFQSRAQQVDDFGNGSLPSDHTAIRIEIRGTIQGWLTKHLVLCSFLETDAR